MNRSTKRGVLTKRLYKFEREYLNSIKPISRILDLPTLTNIAQRTWQKHYTGKRKLPVIRFGPGCLDLGRPMSYTEGFSLIELCPKQRHILTLMHELVHAMGPTHHGINFTKKYYSLLEEFLEPEQQKYAHKKLITDHQKLINKW